mgnify:CR=1 FL=1
MFVNHRDQDICEGDNEAFGMVDGIRQGLERAGNQAGFRKRRSTADGVQIMLRVREDVSNC